MFRFNNNFRDHLTLDQAKEGWLDLILMIFTNVQAVDEDDSSLV